MNSRRIRNHRYINLFNDSSFRSCLNVIVVPIVILKNAFLACGVIINRANRPWLSFFLHTVVYQAVGMGIGGLCCNTLHERPNTRNGSERPNTRNGRCYNDQVGFNIEPADQVYSLYRRISTSG